MRTHRASLSWAIVVAGFPAVIAFAQTGGGGSGHPIPEAERWATITHPGNEPFEIPDPRPGFPARFVGRVDYEYQISRTEVTGAEWLEFARAYAPFVNPADTHNIEFIGSFISPSSFPDYHNDPNTDWKPPAVGWRFAARYANWLHNSKASTREAFETGAYDTSTFGSNPDGTFTDQIAHSVGARYWIPTEDEWVKASHWDPDKNGAGSPGYWVYATSTDTLVPAGPPDAGGQTNAGYLLTDIASYPGVQSPWGLLDTSGGRREWLENALYPFETGLPDLRQTRGSDTITFGNFVRDLFERLDHEGRWGGSPVSTFGLRLARAVPGAWSAGVFSCAIVLLLRRRRSNDEAHLSCPRRRVGAGAPFLDR